MTDRIRTPDATFADLASAGRALADALSAHCTDRAALVLAIVRGGVPAAFEVARALGLPLDLVLLRALVQQASGTLLRAARVAGTLVLDEGCEALPIGSIERGFVEERVRALAEREAACRGARSAASVSGRTIVLIDNGMRTGRTMAAAIRAVRTLNPARIVAATPVGPPAAQALASTLADELHCLSSPVSLGNAAMAYSRFDVPDENRIRAILDRA